MGGIIAFSLVILGHHLQWGYDIHDWEGNSIVNRRLAAGTLVPVFGAQIYNVLPFLAAGAMAISSVTVLGNSPLLFSFKSSFG